MAFSLRNVLVNLAILEFAIFLSCTSTVLGAGEEAQKESSSSQKVEGRGWTTLLTAIAASSEESSSSSSSEEYVQHFNGVYFESDLVKFNLYYDPENSTAFDTLVYNNFSSVNSSHYDPKKETKFLIHGFTENGTSSFPTNVKDAYLKHTGTKFNIIVVDWGQLSSPKNLYPLFYELAYYNVPKVGVRVGEFIIFLKRNSYIIESQVHLIGFSLGAQIASNAGEYVKEQLFCDKVARITGLDPAGPGYVEPANILVKKLQKSDAKFVDVIHANAGGLGYPFPVGHVDFFPNGGTLQPTCGVTTRGINNFVDSLVGLLSGSCSHGKAPIYFAMSLDPEQIGNITACKCFSYLAYNLGCKKSCKTKSVFGEYVSPTTTGTYFLNVIPVSEESIVIGGNVTGTN